MEEEDEVGSCHSDVGPEKTTRSEGEEDVVDNSGRLASEFVPEKELSEGGAGHPRLRSKYVLDVDDIIYNMDFHPSFSCVVAAVTGNKVVVFHMLRPITRIISVFEDTLDEEYYNCTWCPLEGYEHILVVGGKKRRLRLLDCKSNKPLKTLFGHGGCIHEICFHTQLKSLFFTGSGDHSVRLWDIRSGKCIAVFGDHEGPRSEILSVDCHLSGRRIVTSGIDHCIRVWNIDDTLYETMENIHNEKLSLEALLSMKPAIVQIVEYKTSSLHFNYVDCVKWVGDLILSKSAKEHKEPGKYVYLWRYDSKNDVPEKDESFSIVMKYKISDTPIWYIRFGVDRERKLMGVGDGKGRCAIYTVDTGELMGSLQLDSDSIVRSVAFSPDNRYVLAATDEGGVYVFEWETPEVDAVMESEDRQHPVESSQ